MATRSLPKKVGVFLRTSAHVLVVATELFGIIPGPSFKLGVVDSHIELT